MMGTSMDATQLVLEFAALQRQLIDALVCSLRIEPNWTVLADIPRSGVVTAFSEEWDYRRHGVGVMFAGRDSRRVVDAHKFPERWSSAVDAWRLSQYAESVGVRELRHRGVVYPTTDEHQLDVCLAVLGQDHVLQAEEGGRIWVPRSVST